MNDSQIVCTHTHLTTLQDLHIRWTLFFFLDPTVAVQAIPTNLHPYLPVVTPATAQVNLPDTLTYACSMCVLCVCFASQNTDDAGCVAIHTVTIIARARFSKFKNSNYRDAAKMSPTPDDARREGAVIFGVWNGLTT